MSALTVKMGSGTWTINGGYVTDLWDVTDSEEFPVTIIPETSTIKVIGDESNQYFYGGGKTYNDLWITTNGSHFGADSDTFNNLKIDAGVTTYFSDTTTISSLTATGSEGNIITLAGDNGAWSFSCASGIISCNYLNISNSTAEGGATFYAGENSIDGGNNSGWIFTAP